MNALGITKGSTIFVVSHPWLANERGAEQKSFWFGGYATCNRIVMHMVESRVSIYFVAHDKLTRCVNKFCIACNYSKGFCVRKWNFHFLHAWLSGYTMCSIGITWHIIEMWLAGSLVSLGSLTLYTFLSYIWLSLSF